MVRAVSELGTDSTLTGPDPISWQRQEPRRPNLEHARSAASSVSTDRATGLPDVADRTRAAGRGRPVASLAVPARMPRQANSLRLRANQSGAPPGRAGQRQGRRAPNRRGKPVCAGCRERGRPPDRTRRGQRPRGLSRFALRVPRSATEDLRGRRPGLPPEHCSGTLRIAQSGSIEPSSFQFARSSSRFIVAIVAAASARRLRPPESRRMLRAVRFGET